MNKLICLILVTSFSFNAFAGLCDVPEKVAKGDPAPCAGYLFSPALEEKVRTDLVYKDSLIKNLQAASDAQAEIIRIDNNQLDLYKDQLNKQEEANTVQKILYGVLGLVVGYGTAKALQR